MFVHRTSLAALCGTTLLVGGLAACQPSLSGAEQQTTRAYAAPAPVTMVRIRGAASAIHLIGTDKPRTTVQETQHYRNTAPTTSHQQDGGTLTLSYRCPPPDRCTVDYDVEVPKTSAVDIDVFTGDLTITSLTGNLTARTNAGQIIGKALTSAQVDARTNVGSVELDFATAPVEVRANATTGAVTVTLSHDATYAVSASSQVGSAHVNVARDPTSRHHVTATTTTGSVTVRGAATETRR